MLECQLGTTVRTIKQQVVSLRPICDSWSPCNQPMPPFCAERNAQRRAGAALHILLLTLAVSVYVILTAVESSILLKPAAVCRQRHQQPCF